MAKDEDLSYSSDYSGHCKKNRNVIKGEGGLYGAVTALSKYCMLLQGKYL